MGIEILLIAVALLAVVLIVLVFSLNAKVERQKYQLAKMEENMKSNKSDILTQLSAVQKQVGESVRASMDIFTKSLDSNMELFRQMQVDKLDSVEKQQKNLIESTEKKLENIRMTVEEKLDKTLTERLGQSFQLVSKRLAEVQQGLGEMKNLASDVGGLKKVLGNVKMRGGIGEVQLSMLLEQMLAPGQYEANVKVNPQGKEFVEFAVKLPGADNGNIWLPIDAKFPQDVYEHLVDAYQGVDGDALELANRTFEQAILKMAKDIRDKYICPPYSTDFAIMFLPFEGIYGEVVRRAALLNRLQSEYKVIVTGPTTLAAILNSLQMGFKTLAIQKRSSEVWEVLGAVKSEFGKFGGILEKAKGKIVLGLNEIDQLVGVRTRVIESKLREVESCENTGLLDR